MPRIARAARPPTPEAAMLHFAYDGTINGDWASHYAVRLAQHDVEQRLRLIHVDEGKISPESLEERLHLLGDRCRMAGVTLEQTILPRGRTVFEAIAAAVPPGPESFVVCGTRAQQRGRGYLTGTVTERLLVQRRWNVLALRVVRPGVLGHPRRLLLPVAGLPEGLALGLPFLKMLLPDLTDLFVLRVMEVGRFRYRRLTHARREALLEPGRAYLRRIEAELAERLDLGQVRMEGQPIVSDDVPKEIAIAASRVHSDLIYLGASRRNLTERFFYGNPIEQTLRSAPCDVAVYGGPA